MTVSSHLPSWRDATQRPVLAALAVLAVVGARVDLLSPMFDLDSSWAIGLNWASTHGVKFGHDIIFTYGPLVYLTIPLSMYRAPMFMGLLWAVGVSAAAQTALFILTRHVPSRALRLALGAAATLPFGYIWRPEIALLAFALWVLVLLDLQVLHAPNSAIWVGALGALSAIMTLSKFSLLLTFAMLVVACAVSPHIARHLKVAAGSYVAGFLIIWLATGQNLGDIAQWVTHSLSISNGYNTEMSFHFVDHLAGFRIMGLLFAALALLAIIVWRPVLHWWQHRTRQNAAALVIIGLLFYFFLKQSFVRFDAMHASAVFGALCILSIAVLPQQRTPAWMSVFPIALILGTLGQSLPPVRGIDTWFVVRSRVESVKQIGDGLHQVVSADYHRDKSARDWARVDALGLIPVGPIKSRIGNATVAIEPAHISAAFAMGLNWRPMYTLQAYSAFTPWFDNKNASQLTAPDAPEFILARYSTIDMRNQLWTSPAYQLAITCNYELVDDLNPWKIFRKAANRCGTPVDIETVSAVKSQVIQTPKRQNSIVVARFHYSTGLLDKLSSTALRPLITPLVRIDDQRVRIVNGVMSQPHIISQPPRIAGRATPWGGITYDEIEFLNVPGTITVTFSEVPLTGG